MIERLKTYKGKINSENEYKNEVTSPSQSDNDNKEKEKEIIFKVLDFILKNKIF